MVTVIDILERLKRVDVERESENSIIRTKENIIEKQKDQMLHGLKQDGSLIGKYRSKKYAAKKFQLNPLAGLGNMDWKLTGDLHKAIFVDASGGDFFVDSADTKTQGLIDKNGDPFGLQQKNKEDYVNQTLGPVFLERMHSATGL